jgi:hypothetical protein
MAKPAVRVQAPGSALSLSVSTLVALGGMIMLDDFCLRVLRQSRKLQAPPFWLWNLSTKFHGSVKPEFDSLMAVSESAIGRISMRCATGKLWNFGNKGLVLVAPVDDDLVLMH